MSSETITFDKDVPPPAPPKRQLIEDYRIADMEPGHSFFRPGDLTFTERLKTAVQEWAKKQTPERKFTTARRSEPYPGKKDPEKEGIRIWRIT